MSDYNSNLSDPILQTKLFRPALRAELINRRQLIDRLNAGLGTGLQKTAARHVLVSAPAGFGKTTLVSAWLAQLEDVQPAWLSLDEGENDPVRFLAYLIAALQTAVPSIGETATRLLQSSQPAAADSVLTVLINDISQNGRPIILVLDDYQAITSPVVHQALTYLVDHLPPQLHLLVSTRSDPPLPLSRLRARGQLLEIRANDLRFSLDETGKFFSQLMDLALDERQLAVLEQRTEGWIAGMQLAALSMQGRDDLPAFIDAFAGSNRYVLDYLSDEVLARRPKGTRDFLLQTSFLNRFCGPLCDAVTGQTGSQETLERLEQANLFLISLDEDRNWYRYHHLFAEVLLRRLQQEQPSILPDLHRKAQAWFEQSGLLHEAIEHALSGHDYEGAARLIESVYETMLHAGASTSLMRWLDALPQEMVRARARLCLACGWTRQMGASLDLDRAEAWAQQAIAAAKSAGQQDPTFDGELAALRAMIAAGRIDMASSRSLARQALEMLPPASRWRSAMAFTLGTAHFDFGEMTAAADRLAEAVRLSRQDGVYYVQMAAASFLADISMLQGHLGQAEKMYEQIIGWTIPDFPQKGGVMAHGGLATIYYERNDLNSALQQVQLGAAQLDRVGGAWAAYVVQCIHARIHWARGNKPAALEILDEVHEIGRQAQVGLVASLAAAQRAELQLAQGDLAAAENWASSCGLAAVDDATGHPGWHEAEYLTLARVLGARGKDAAARNAEALSLLERLLHSAEVEGRFGSAVSIYVLLALFAHRQGDSSAALESLERALALGEPEGYRRVFIDEGSPMVELLRLARGRGLSSRYLDTLLNAFIVQGIMRPPSELLPDLLSERELEVLHLVAAGASNKEIADRLYLAVPTVKKHLSNIMSKLDAANRTQAVAEARSLDLL